jgi:hypothetical protein
MIDDVDEIAKSLNINKILISVLESVGEVRVPALTFLDGNDDKVLVVEYDEVNSSFIFKLKDK